MNHTEDSKMAAHWSQRGAWGADAPRFSDNRHDRITAVKSYLEGIEEGKRLAKAEVAEWLRHVTRERPFGPEAEKALLDTAIDIEAGRAVSPVDVK